MGLFKRGSFLKQKDPGQPSEQYNKPEDQKNNFHELLAVPIPIWNKKSP